MLAVFFGRSSGSTRFKDQFQILLISLLFLKHANISRGELVFINFVVFHLFYGELVVPFLVSWLYLDESLSFKKKSCHFLFEEGFLHRLPSFSLFSLEVWALDIGRELDKPILAPQLIGCPLRLSRHDYCWMRAVSVREVVTAASFS